MTPAPKIGPLRQATLHLGCVFLALWQILAFRWLVLMLIIGAMLVFVSGCKSATVPANRPPIDAKPLISAHEGKDRAVVDWAAKIDARLDDLAAGRADLATVVSDIKAATSAQRAEVAKAPASQFSVIIDALQRNASDDAKTIEKLRAELASARDAVDRVIRIGGYALAAILGAAAAASLFLAAQVPWLGPRISAALGAASVSIFAMVWAYEWTKQHPWITAITGACVLVAAALAYANHLHDKSKPTS